MDAAAQLYKFQPGKVQCLFENSYIIYIIYRYIDIDINYAYIHINYCPHGQMYVLAVVTTYLATWRLTTLDFTIP